MNSFCGGNGKTAFKTLMNRTTGVLISVFFMSTCQFILDIFWRNSSLPMETSVWRLTYIYSTVRIFTCAHRYVYILCIDICKDGHNPQWIERERESNSYIRLLLTDPGSRFSYIWANGWAERLLFPMSPAEASLGVGACPMGYYHDVESLPLRLLCWNCSGSVWFPDLSRNGTVFSVNKTSCRKWLLNSLQGTFEAYPRLVAAGCQWGADSDGLC